MTCCGDVEGDLCYIQGAELGDVRITWLDDGIVDFSGAWEFEAKVGKEGQPAVVTKTTGIGGAATAPNVTVEWDAGQLDPLAPGRWVFQLRATLGGRDRIMQAPLTIKRAVT